MFKGFAAIRNAALGIIFLRRISCSLHKIHGELSTANDLKRAELEIQFPAQMKAWYSEAKRKKGERKPLEISIGSYGDWDKNWRETRERGYDPDDEDLGN